MGTSGHLSWRVLCISVETDWIMCRKFNQSIRYLHWLGLSGFCEVANVMMRLLSPSSNSRNSSPVVV